MYYTCRWEKNQPTTLLKRKKAAVSEKTSSKGEWGQEQEVSRLIEKPSPSGQVFQDPGSCVASKELKSPKCGAVSIRTGNPGRAWHWAVWSFQCFLRFWNLLSLWVGHGKVHFITVCPGDLWWSRTQLSVSKVEGKFGHKIMPWLIFN